MLLKKEILLIRDSRADDIAFVMRLEAQAGKSGSVIIWSKERHLEALEHESTLHLILQDDDKRVGYAIVELHEDNFELMRIVIEDTGRGYGTTFINMLLDYAFKQLSCHRFWLDARAHNVQAIALYKRLGFVEEGVLREAVKLSNGYVDVIIMSILASEYLIDD